MKALLTIAWQWLLAGGWLYVLGGIAFLSMAIANALTTHYSQKTGLAKAFLFVAEVCSFLTSKGAPGVIKLPLTVGKPPADDDKKDPPTFPPGGGLALVAVLLLVGGCADIAFTARKVEGTIAIGTVSAVETWQSYDLAKQREILSVAANRADFDRMIAAYRAGEQARVARAFTTLRFAASTLDHAIDAYEAGTGKKPDVEKALRDALVAVGELMAALKAAGLAVPDILSGLFGGAK